MSDQPQLNGKPAGEIPPVFPEFPVNNDRESIMANVRTNAARGLPILTQSGFIDTPVLMVGGGPSLLDHIDEIIQFQAAGAKVFAINGAYKYLKSEGVASDYFFLIDSRAGNVVHVESPSKETLHILASQVHPKVFDLLTPYKVQMVHLATEATMDALGGKGTFLTAPIGFAGIHAIYAAAALGFKHQFLFGYDFSYEESHHAFPQPLNDNDTTIEVTLGDKVYRTTDAMAEAARHFRMAVAPLIEICDVDLRMFSEGLLPDIIDQAQGV